MLAPAAFHARRRRHAFSAVSHACDMHGSMALLGGRRHTAYCALYSSVCACISPYGRMLCVEDGATSSPSDFSRAIGTWTTRRAITDARHALQNECRLLTMTQQIAAIARQPGHVLLRTGFPDRYLSTIRDNIVWFPAGRDALPGKITRTHALIGFCLGTNTRAA